MPNTQHGQLSLGAEAARQLATAHVTPVQNLANTPRWLHKLLPWVDVRGGVYRVNRRKIIGRPYAHVDIQHGAEGSHVVAKSLRHLAPFGGLSNAEAQAVADRFTAAEYGVVMWSHQKAQARASCSSSRAGQSN